MRRITALAASALLLALTGCQTESGPTEHAGAITANETWESSGNPHIIKSSVSVENNATLTIKPGCVVMFASGTELDCEANGAIVAEGTADSRIRFTSNVASPSPGGWKGIDIYKDAMSTTSFKYCTIEYGGGSDDSGSLYVEGCGIQMSNCTIQKSGSYGIVMTGNAYFTTFSSNIVTECAKQPLFISPEFVRTIGSGNGFTGNTNDAILVDGGEVVSTGTWPDLGIPYEIKDTVSIGDNTNSPTITIGPGAIVKMQNKAEIEVGYSSSGGLIADGTVSKITFTGVANPPVKGDWVCVSFYDHAIDANSIIKNCKLEYGGNGGYGNIYIQDAMPEITGDSIGYSKGYGIYVAGGEYPDITALGLNNVFYNNDSGDINSP